MNEKTKILIACAFLLCGFVFFFLGFMREENLTVLNKSINICLECIGIG